MLKGSGGCNDGDVEEGEKKGIRRCLETEAEGKGGREWPNKGVDAVMKGRGRRREGGSDK